MSEAVAGNRNRNLLLVCLALNCCFLFIEVVGGILTHSLALLADGGHMASDVGALLLSAIAATLAFRPATKGRTYGFARAEILAAFVNGVALIAISVFIFWEAFRR
ncbi:MAG: cation diffusion facilitator family transporter, partial [Chloroflexota bacterium]